MFQTVSLADIQQNFSFVAIRTATLWIFLDPKLEDVEGGSLDFDWDLILFAGELWWKTIILFSPTTKAFVFQRAQSSALNDCQSRDPEQPFAPVSSCTGSLLLDISFKLMEILPFTSGQEDWPSILY